MPELSLAHLPAFAKRLIFLYKTDCYENFLCVDNFSFRVFHLVITNELIKATTICLPTEQYV